MAERSNTTVIDLDDDGFDIPFKPSTRIDGSAGSPGNSDRGIEDGTRGDEVRTEYPHPTSSGFETLSPFDIGPGRSDGNDGTPTRRKRGRPRGSTNTPKTGVIETPTYLGTAALETLEAVLLGVHFGLAKVMNEPCLELDESEARKMSDSLKELAKLYQTVIDPKKLAWIRFSMVIGGIYAPRVITIVKGVKKSAGPQKVVDITRDKPKPEPVPTTAPQPKPDRPQSPSEMWAESPIEDWQG